MPRRSHKIQISAAEQEILEKEHGDILRQYIELDDAILHGQGSPRILEAARTLLQYMLLYFAHEEQFQRKTSLLLREEQRQLWRKDLAELLQIEAGLKQAEVYSALRMRSLCRSWMHHHEQSSAISQKVSTPPTSPERERALA
jgi:hemerythrin